MRLHHACRNSRVHVAVANDRTLVCVPHLLCACRSVAERSDYNIPCKKTKVSRQQKTQKHEANKSGSPIAEFAVVEVLKV